MASLSVRECAEAVQAEAVATATKKRWGLDGLRWDLRKRSILVYIWFL